MTWRAFGQSLMFRLAGVSLLLLLLVQAAGFLVVRASIERNARAQIAVGLDADERVWRRLIGQNAERLQQASALLAADYGFRSAVNSGDAETIASVLYNHGGRIGAAVAALLDTEMQLVVSSAADASSDSRSTLLGVLPLLTRQPGRSQIAIVAGVPYQFVMVPMRAPLVIGWVLMGFPVGQALAAEMHQLQSIDVAIVVRGPDGQRSVPVSTLPEVDRQRLAGLAGDDEVQMDGGPLLIRRVPLESANGETLVLLMRSLDGVLAPYRHLQVLLGAITLAGVALFAVGFALMARRVAAPLRAVTEATQRISRGNYAEPIEHTHRTDEIGRLARSFDRMRLGIAAQQDEIRQLADTDRLTGVPNRERFRRLLMEAMEHGGRSGEPLSVITLDLDRFQQVNDVLGYALGDRLLQAVVARIAAHLRTERELVARLGGNEFAVLLPGADEASARDTAQRITRAFESPLVFDDQMVDLSAGIGIACWPGPADDADTLLSHAEIAMYAAKRRLHGAQIYDPSMESSSAAALSLLSELRHAVEAGELRLFLQPKLRLDSQAGCGAEALVRWQHPVRGLVPPMQFIPFAEQTGFVRQLTLWIFEQAARYLARPQVRGLGLRISVNLSTRDLMDTDLSTRLGTLMARHGVESGDFCLEITESAIMDDPGRAEAMLNRLSAQGFKLSIDDFGTGYSSLAYLKRLPVDELKIDKSFVMGMAVDAGDAQIVRSTIDLAHNLGLSVVAEGVESAAILEQLRGLRCDEAQGYHIGRPMPADDFLAWHTAAAARK